MCVMPPPPMPGLRPMDSSTLNPSVRSLLKGKDDSGQEPPAYLPAGRSAKIKCDGKLPACTACEKASREDECSSANDQFARGKERSYVAALELRIEKLERRIQYAKMRKASVALHDSDALAAAHFDRRDSLASIRAAIHRKAARHRENSDVNSLVSDFGLLSVNATTRDFGPSTINITFARLVLAATSIDPIPETPHQGLPSRQTANAIFQHFMKNVYPLFPSFSETTALNILNDVYQQDNRAIKDSDYWLIFMILAIGSTTQSQKINDEWYLTGIDFVSRALAYADRALAPGYVTQIQSLLLLCQYAILDPAHFDSWLLIGFTTRAVVDLGFHQDPPTSSSTDRSALDMRRKLFYCTYALDRSISMVHARTFSFTDESVDVAFPSTPNSRRKVSVPNAISGPQSADPGILLFQLRRAQSYWYQELYQSDAAPLANAPAFVWQVCSHMREWGDSLPVSLPPGIRQMFEQELRYSYVYCIAPSPRGPQITDYHRMLIFEHSWAYLRVMHEITHTGLHSTLYNYHDALKVYFMGNQFLAVLRDAQDMLLSNAQLQFHGGPMAPPIPQPQQLSERSVDGRLGRSLWCLASVPQTLAKFGERWEIALMLKHSFEQLSEETFERLREFQSLALQQQQQQQQQMPSPYLNGVVASASPVPVSVAVPVPVPVMQQGHHSPRGMQWVGVDMSHTYQPPHQ